MAGLTGKKNKGVALVEILVAFAVFALGMTAVMLVVFGGQSFALDSKLTQRALYHAERGIEESFASSRTAAGFLALASGTSSLESLLGDDEIYGDEIEIDVLPISECVKKVKSRVSWNQEQRSRFAELVSIFVSASTSEALGGDCITEEISDDWSNPEAFDATSLDFKKATDVSVVKNSGNRFAVLTSEKAGSSATFWAVDVTDPENPSIVGSYDTGTDMLAVTAVKIDDVSYAFAVGASSTTQGQLRVFDLTIPSAIASGPVANRDLPNINQNCSPLSSSLCRAGVSIYYYDHKIYVGTKHLAFGVLGSNHELHIFNVSDPTNPVWEGSVNVDRNVNNIVVRDGLAYLANGPGDTNDSLRVYDVSNPGTISMVGSFTVDHAQQGTRITILDGKLYFGLENNNSGPVNKKTFYILGLSNPANPTELGFKDLGIKKNTEVKGIEVVENLAFIATSDQEDSSDGGPFMVYDISDPENMVLVSTCGINFSERATGLDFGDNMAFMSKETPAGDGGLIIIHPSPVCN
jgi:hypothetical protein